MTAVRKLTRFEVEGSGQEFTLRIEGEGGSTIELLASRDQLDVIADALDDVLLADQSADEVDDRP